MSTIWYAMEAKRVWHGGSTVWCGGGGGRGQQHDIESAWQGGGHQEVPCEHT